MKAVKIGSLLIALLLATATVYGAGSGEASAEGSVTAESVQPATAAEGERGYPLDTDVTLTYWLELTGNTRTSVTNYGETPFAENLERRTGVAIEYLHPPAGQTFEALNILLASGDLPDLMQYSWATFKGGPNKAISDGYIIKLNDVYEEYAPNLTKYLTEHPQIDKTTKTDDGTYYVFPHVRGGAELLNSAGYIVREDWLDDLGLDRPETIDEWYTMLTAFRDRMGAEAPLSVGYNHLRYMATGFGVVIDDFRTEGRLIAGAVQPETRAWLAEMNRWYEEGLLDINFATLDRNTMNSNVLTGKSGAIFGSGGSGVGNLMNASEVEGFSLVGVKYPSPVKGEMPEFGNMSDYYNTWGSVGITTDCEDVAVAARFLDYGYSDEGVMFYNFGEEGVTYNMADGFPQFTDLITNHPDGLSMAQAAGLYIKSANVGPMIQDPNYLVQYYSLPQQQESLANWQYHNYAEHKVSFLTPTDDEASRLSRIENDLDTFQEEMFMKFIMGTEPIESFDDFVDQMFDIGLEEAVSIKQAALDRFGRR
jgi:putative aldouronate transport system substrate-binding protein